MRKMSLVLMLDYFSFLAFKAGKLIDKLIIQTKALSEGSGQRSRDLEVGFFSLLACS